MATYLLMAWLIVQVLDVVGPSLGLPERAMTYAVISLAVGFPVVAIVSWFFELTTHGLIRESTDADVPPPPTSNAISYVIISMLAAALGVSLLLRPPSPSPQVSDTERPSVAVLPLSNFGDDDDQGFVAGLHDDLLTVLSRIDAMRVISRTSVQGFAGTDLPLTEIGRRLSADVILEGSVQRSGGRIRVNVQLIDAREDDHLWAQVFEQPYSAFDLFSIQREIALAIARELRLVITGRDTAELERRPTDNVEAYSAYLLGLQRVERRTSDSLEGAEAFFRRAIAMDAGFADAWAGLAYALDLQHTYASVPADATLREAMPAVQQALALDPGLSLAHAVLGDLRGLTGDMQGAEAAFTRAIELNPNNAVAYHLYGTMLYSDGRVDEAIDAHGKALELNPLSATASNALAQDLLAAGRSDEAVEQYQRSVEIEPEFAPTYAHLSQLERFVYGRPDKAVLWLNKAFRQDPRHSEYAALIVEAMLELDAPLLASQWSRLAMETAPTNYWPARVALLVALRGGDRQEIKRALDHYDSSQGPGWLSLTARRDWLLESDEPDKAREIFLTSVPAFFTDPPEVAPNNFYLAPSLAVALQARGETDAARALLERALAVLADMRASGYEDFDIAEVELLALLGESDRALEVLDAGVSNDWLNIWWFMATSGNLAPLHDDPRFETVFERIRVHMHALRDGLEGKIPAPVTPLAAEPL